MKKILTRIYNNKSFTVLILIFIQFLSLVFIMRFSTDKSLTLFWIESAIIIFSGGFLSILTIPIIYINNRVMKGVFKDSYDQINKIFLGCIILYVAGMISFFVFVLRGTKIPPIYFSKTGIMFTIIIYEKLIVRTKKVTVE